jgi:Kef-type K+ transport system membrane component KefB/mannitol/fructose-specific phosphotransferase system IIA component (Ntr-type)
MSHDLFHLPLADPVMIFALAMVIFVSVPLFFERFRMPGIIGLIVAGAVVGPNGLALLERNETIVLLGTVGLLYLMFMAGVEIDLHGFRKYRNRSLVFGAVTFLLPQLLGTGVGFALGYGVAASVLLASMFASHTLVAYPIASRLGIAKNEAVTATVGGTIITDCAALLVLAVIAASAEGGLTAAFGARLGLSLVVFVAVVLLGVPRLGRWFFRHYGDSPTAEYVFVLAVLFTCAGLAEFAGVEAIIGAFLAGLAINRLIPESGPLNNRLHFFGNALFIPFFLFSVGMLVDVRVLAGSGQAWKVMIGMTVTVIVTKWLAARIAQRLFGYSGEEGWLMFGLSVPQAAATLAAALIGYQIQLFDDAVLNGAILMILVTCTLGPWLVERYGRRLALREARAPYRPSEAPQRILVAISNPASAEPLVDLALLVRDPDSAEPVHPLIVVPGRGEEDEAIPQVAAAEKLLARAVIHGAAADVPMVPLTRVDHNYAHGIVRGITETRSNTVVVGWDRRRSRRFGLTGGMVERITERMQQLLLVARLAPPINTVARMVVVLPPCSERSRGFCDAVRTLKIMANRLGAEVVGRVVEGNCTDYESVFEATKPAAPARFEPVPGWRALLPALTETLRPDDLVVIVSARHGTLAWSRTLEQLPWRIEDALPNSFVVVYPAEVEQAPDPQPATTVLSGAITTDRVAIALPRGPFQQTLEELTRLAVPDDAALRGSVLEGLVRQELDGATELVPGVVAPNARVEGLREPVLVVGVSPDGIEFPEATAPAHLIFLVLTPADHPQEHMNQLAELARLARSSERLQELLRGVDADSVLERFRTDARRPQTV